MARPVVVVLGPTATGKTAVSVALALRLGGEIVSADSRAFFRELDIVTDKPDETTRQGIPHHLIDRVSWEESYDVMAFRADVERLLPQIRARGRLPLLVGGGTLYLEALLRGVFEGPSRDDALRTQMADRTSISLHEELRVVDPLSADRIHPNDRLRLERALEVYHASGTPISSWQARAEPIGERFHVVGLIRSPDDHRASITERVHQMLSRGVLDEIEDLRARGLSPQLQSYRTIGVPEAVDVLEGRLSVSGFVDRVIQQTWQLARRQMSWFRRDQHIHWIRVTHRTLEEITDEILRTLPWEVYP